MNASCRYVYISDLFQVLSMGPASTTHYKAQSISTKYLTNIVPCITTAAWWPVWRISWAPAASVSACTRSPSVAGSVSGGSCGPIRGEHCGLLTNHSSPEHGALCVQRLVQAGVVMPGHEDHAGGGPYPRLQQVRGYWRHKILLII